MIKFIFAVLLLCTPAMVKCQTDMAKLVSPRQFHKDNDSLVWQTISTFTTLFNKSDTNAMKQFLPDDFILQWMHENFVTKKNILKAMRDSAVHATMMHTISSNHAAIVRYSDDYTAVSVNTSFDFLDPTFSKKIISQKGYTMCIAYLQRINNKWVLKTVHMDIHCSLCDL